MGSVNVLHLGILVIGIHSVVYSTAAQIKVTSIQSYPYMQLKASNVTSNNTEPEYEGFIMDVLDGMAEITGHVFDIHMVPDGKYGMYDPNTGAANGMIEELISRKADVAAAPLTITLNREMAVDFLFPFETHEAHIVMSRRHPDQQPRINNLEDLIGQDEVKYGVLKDGAVEYAIKNSKDELLQAMWSNMTGKTHAFKATNQEGVNRARADHYYAFIMEGSTARVVASKPPCDLEIVNAGFYKRQYAFAVDNQSPLRDTLNRAQIILQNNGKMDEYFRRWFADECSSAVKMHVSFVSLILAAVFLML